MDGRGGSSGSDINQSCLVTRDVRVYYMQQPRRAPFHHAEYVLGSVLLRATTLHRWMGSISHADILVLCRSGCCWPASRPVELPSKI